MKFRVHSIQTENRASPQEAIIEFDPFDYIDAHEIISGLLEWENESWGSVRDFRYEVADDR